MKLWLAGGCLCLGLVFSSGLVRAQAGFPPENLTWQDFTVDFGLTGQLSSIAVEPGGRPHIAYRDLVNGLLKYGRKNNNNTWSVWTVDTAGDVGWGISLALDGANNPHFSYYRSSGGVALGAAVYAKGSCTPQGQSAVCSFTKSVIESGIQNIIDANNTSIAVDPSGVPHVVYVDNTNDKIKWARKLAGSTSWDIANVVTVEGAAVSMALDSNNLPHIAYSDQVSDQIKYVSIFCQFILCGWSFETIDTGTDPALRRAPDGRVHVAYRKGGMVHYALRSGGTWSLLTVGQAGNGGFFPALALDGAGAPHITFVRNLVGVGELIYARRWKFGWNLEVADFDVVSSANASIAVDANNIRHISCGGSSDDSIRHLEGTPPPPPVFLP